MSFQPSKHSARSQQPSFTRQPTSPTHRLDFAITASSSRGIKLGARNATTTTASNNNGTNHKNNSNNYSNTTVSSSTSRTDSDHTSQASSMSRVARPATATTTQTTTTQGKPPSPHELAPPQTGGNPVRLTDVTSPNPLPFPPPPTAHYQQFATNTEQNRTTPKVHQVSLPLPRESMQHQLSPRVLSISPTFPTHGSTIPQLLPRHNVVGSGVGYTAAEHGVGQVPVDCTVQEAGPGTLENRDVNNLNITPANFAHELLLKQEEVSPPTILQDILSSYSAKGGMVVAPANTSDMPTNYLRERIVSRSSPTVAAPVSALVNCGDGPEEQIVTVMMKKAEIERQWLGVEQQKFRLIDELQLKVQEESDKYYVANQEVKAMGAKNTVLQATADQLQAKGDQLQAQVFALEGRLNEAQSLLRETDRDRAKLTEVQGQLRGQTATKIESINAAMASAQRSLENLSFDKAQVEIESARLKIVIQELETDRGDDFKELQVAYNKTLQIGQRQFDDIANYKTRCETHEVTIESLNTHLRQQTAMACELRREIDVRGVAIDSLEVTNASLADRIEFLTQSSDYQQSVLQSQLQDVSAMCQENHDAELEKVRAERDTDKETYTSELTRMQSSIKELQAEFQNLVARNQRLVDEMKALRDEKLRQTERIAQLQEGASTMEVENRRLLSSSMEAQSDYTEEINNTILEFESRLEERRRRVQEREQEIQAKDTQISELQSQIQTMTSDIDASKEENRQLDREMLELRVKIQLLQTDYEFITNLRDELQFELQNLQEQIRNSSNNGSVGVLARLVIGSSSSNLIQQDPMPLTDIARLHSRDQGASSAATDFSPWPLELGTPPTLDSSVAATSADTNVTPVTKIPIPGSPSSPTATPTVTTAMTTSSSRIATDIADTTTNTTIATPRVRMRSSGPASTTTASVSAVASAGGSRPSPSSTIQQRGTVGGRGEEVYHHPPPAKRRRGVTTKVTTPTRVIGVDGSSSPVNNHDDHGESEDDDGDDEADFAIEPRANAPPPRPHASTSTSTNA
ncbi:hypothetical protein BGZ95_002008, partial [Linnemannia exigua]